MGSFQVLSSHLFTHPRQSPEYSFIDFAFGSSTKAFAGNHRFVVRRGSSLLSQRASTSFEEGPDTNPTGTARPSDDETAGLIEAEVKDSLKFDEVEIRLEGYHCDPLKDGYWAGKRLFLHEWYARLLLVNGVRSVLAGAAVEAGHTKLT